MLSSNEDYIQTFSDREDEDINSSEWHLDEYRRAMLNEFMEISIGGFVFVYYSENRIYKIHEIYSNPNNITRTLTLQICD